MICSRTTEHLKLHIIVESSLFFWDLETWAEELTQMSLLSNWVFSAKYNFTIKLIFVLVNIHKIFEKARVEICMIYCIIL